VHGEHGDGRFRALCGVSVLAPQGEDEEADAVLQPVVERLRVVGAARAQGAVLRGALQRGEQAQVGAGQVGAGDAELARDPFVDVGRTGRRGGVPSAACHIGV